MLFGLQDMQGYNPARPAHQAGSIWAITTERCTTTQPASPTRTLPPTATGSSSGSASFAANAAAALAGPILIVVAVAAVLHSYLFGSMLAPSDALTYWLPTYCLMGKTLAAGHIPSWSPFTMAGAPFASDPQSGWMYVPAMLLFTVLPCGAAIRVLMVMQPALAGLGIYAFLRSEGTSRAGATVGGLVLALGMAGTAVTLSIPISSGIAWTTLTLAACSRYFRSTTWSGRLAWALAVGFAWGQLAAAFLSDGLIIGTGALVALVAAKVWIRTRRERVRLREVALALALLVGALLLVSLAYFVPRLAYLPRTSLGAGYAHLQALGERVLGQPPGALEIGPGTTALWPLDFAASPGPYLGAVALALVFAGLWSERFRPVVIAFAVFGAACWLLTLQGVATGVPASLQSQRFVDTYLHDPQRFGFVLPLVVGMMAGFGLDAWRSGSWRALALMVLPGVAVWGGLPLWLHAPHERLALLGIGALLAAVGLATVRFRPRLAAVVPALLMVELLINGFTSAPAHHRVLYRLQPFRPRPSQMAGLLPPSVEVSGYTQPGTIGRALQHIDGRYMTIGPGPAQERGQRSGGIGFLNQAEFFRTESVGGYNPIQILRYWIFVRAVQASSISYNRALFLTAPATAVNLLQVSAVVAPLGQPPAPDAIPGPVQGKWQLFTLPHPAPRAELYEAAVAVPPARDFPNPALDRILDPSFDPTREVVVEAAPGTSLPAFGTGTGGTATTQALGPQHTRTAVHATAPSLLLVRVPYDPGWHASIDHHAVPLLRADYILQAVVVPPGDHVVELTYDDPSVRWGLAGSAAVVVALGGAAVVLWRRERRRLNGPAGLNAPYAGP